MHFNSAYYFTRSDPLQERKGDIDGDGKEDVVFDVNAWGTRVIRNMGTEAKPRWFLSGQLPGVGWRAYLDINGDGVLDAVFGGGEYAAGS